MQKEVVDLIDVYKATGYPKLSNEKLYERRSFFSQRPNMLCAQRAILRLLKRGGYTHVLFTTMDICIDFLDKSFLVTIKSEGMNLGAILGDDEFNYLNFRSIVHCLDFIVVYLEKVARYYKKFTPAKIMVQNNCYSSKNLIPLKSFVDKKIDIIMVGAPFKSRLKVLKSLIQDPSINIAIYGPPKRWNKYPKYSSYYKGFLSADDFYEVISESKFVFCSFLDMKGKKHMNTKIWEAITAGSVPVCEHYPALSYQFGLIGHRELPYYKSSCDLLKILKKNQTVLDVENLRHYINGNYDYETSYQQVIGRLKEVEPTCASEVSVLTHYCAAAVVLKNIKIRPYIFIPGQNIYKIDGTNAFRLGLLQSIKALLTQNISRTDFILSEDHYSSINLINKYVYTTYLILKMLKKNFSV